MDVYTKSNCKRDSTSGIIKIGASMARFGSTNRILMFGWALVALAAANSLTWRMGNDQAVFTVIAQKILDGGMPYRDAWDLKGPLTFYVYAFALWVWHRPGLSIRILDLIAVVACAYLMGRLVNGIAKDLKVAWGSTIIFLLMYFSLGYWNTAQPDGWGGFILVGVVLLLVDPPWKATTSMAVAGGLVAAATLLKPTFAAYMALPIALPCAYAADKVRRLNDLLVCTATFCLAISIPFMFLWAAMGGWNDMLDVVRYFVVHVSDRTGLNVLAFPYFLAYWIPTILAAVGIVILYRSTDRRIANIVALWVGIGIFITAVQGKYDGYQFIPFLVSALVPISAAIKFVASLNRKWLLVSVCVIALGPLAAYSVNPKDSSGAYERAQVDVAAYVVTHSGATDSILVMAGELQPVYALSHRSPPTRFVYSYPLNESSQLRAKYRSVFMKEINQHAPFYVLFDSRDAWFFGNFPEFSDFLRAKYALTTRIGTNEIWQINRPCCIEERAVSPDAQTLDFGPWAR